MAVTAKLPTDIEQYFDKDGRLTHDGIRFFQQIIRKLEDLEARVVVLEP